MQNLTSSQTMTLTETSDHLVVGNESQILRYRSSAHSILDDPFFRTYSTPKEIFLDHELKSAKNTEYFENEGFITKYTLPSPISSRIHTRSLSDLDLSSVKHAEMENISIAVIGSAGVGKSTLIQQVLKLDILPDSTISDLEIPIENTTCKVTVHEIDLQLVEINFEKKITWPVKIKGHALTKIDAVLMLYDITDKESSRSLLEIYNGLINSFLPSLFISCNCSSQDNSFQIDISKTRRAYYSSFDERKRATHAPDTARFCLNAILKTILKNTKAPDSIIVNEQISFRMIQSLNFSDDDFKYDHDYFAISSLSGRSSSPAILPYIPGFHAQKLLSSSINGTYVQNKASLQLKKHQLCSISISSSYLEITETITNNLSNTMIKNPNNSLDVKFSDRDTFFHHPDKSCFSQRGDCFINSNIENIGESLVLKHQDEDETERAPTKLGLTLDELMDRLTRQSMSRADKNFIDIFLCLYRKFAAPGELLSGILARLDLITNDSNMHVLTKAENQFRILNVFSKWISAYPGDFAGPSTSQRLERFLSNLIFEPKFATAAYELRLLLRTHVVINDDTGWAQTDPDFEALPEINSETDPTSIPCTNNYFKSNSVSSASSSFDDEEKEGLTENIPRIDVWGGSVSSALSFKIIENHEREAATMIPRNIIPLSKYRFYIFMQIPDDNLSDELTRIDWLMFSTIRLRGLVRHVSLSSEEKGNWKDLNQVNRMITHFNHVANWVASLILMRDKAKHRAMMLEKFINIAQRLRQLNNFNGLAAVLAGLNSCAIYRLSQTWSLVPKDIFKRYTRLTILMGVQRSHSAYRLAWKSSNSFRIPFLPLHRRDLVSAVEGNRTFIDSNEEFINWKKFEILSEIILPLMKSQMIPYPNLVKSKNVRELILDFKIMIDDEELYKRSLAVESNTSGSTDFGKKKFLWF